MKQPSPSLFRRHVVRANPVISTVLSSHLLIEHSLVRSLYAVMPSPAALFRSRTPSFFQLVDLAESLTAVPPDLAAVLRCLNTLRNQFAHRLSYDPTSQEIDALLRSLKEMDEPFYVSLCPPPERELLLALASVCGRMEMQARSIGATEL